MGNGGGKIMRNTIELGALGDEIGGSIKRQQWRQGWVVGCRSVTCSWRFGLGWSEGNRKNERWREEGRWTQLARRTMDGGRSLHGTGRQMMDGVCMATKASMADFLYSRNKHNLNLFYPLPIFYHSTFPFKPNRP